MEQMELFETEHDSRVDDLREYIQYQLCYNRFWFPSAKLIVKIGEEFKVVGSKPLEIFYQELKSRINTLRLVWEDEDNEEIRFYERQLKALKDKI